MLSRALLLFLLLLSCTPAPQAAPTRPAPAAQAPSKLPVIPVQLLTEEGPVTIRAEVVDTPPLRQRGLMFREQLPEDRGMLFLFPKEGPRSFWMRNTLIPLDMVFIRADHTVLGVVHQATPKTDTPRGVSGDSQFVLELAGGVAKRRGIQAGQRVEFMAPIPAN